MYLRRICVGANLLLLLSPSVRHYPAISPLNAFGTLSLIHGFASWGVSVGKKNILFIVVFASHLKTIWALKWWGFTFNPLFLIMYGFFKKYFCILTANSNPRISFYFNLIRGHLFLMTFVNFEKGTFFLYIQLSPTKSRIFVHFHMRLKKRTKYGREKIMPSKSIG